MGSFLGTAYIKLSFGVISKIKKMESQRTPLRDVTNTYPINVSTSSTEDMSEDGMDPDVEICLRKECRDWLDLHGAKLFALETSKYLAAEAKRKNLRSIR